MRKLIRFEVKKAIGSRFFLIVFCLALLADFLLQCGIQEYWGYVQAVRTSQGSVQTVETYFEFVSGERKVARRLESEYAQISSLSDAERAALTVELQEKYGKAVMEAFPFDMPNEMQEIPGVLGNISDSAYLLGVMGLETHNGEAKERLDSVLRAAQSFQEEAEAKGDGYGIRRNGNILRLYAQPREEITQPPRYGDDLLASPTMLFVFLLILLTAAVSVSGEHDRRTWLLLHTAKNGMGKTLLSKCIAGWLIGAVLTAILQGVTLLAFLFRGGSLGADQPVSILSSLSLCPYPLLVWQYMLLAFACQLFTALLLTTVLIAISALCKNGLIAYGAGTLFLGGSLLLYYFPPKSQWLAGPLALAKPERYFGSYNTCNLFGFPVLWAVIHAILWTAIAAAFMLFAYRVYHRKRRVI